MGEIYVKKNNAFERVVSDGNTVIVQGGGGGGGGVTIAFSARRGTSSPNPHIQGIGNVGTPPYASGPNTISLCDSEWISATPSAYTETHNQGTTDAASPSFEEARVRHISKGLLDNVEINKSSLNSGVPFDGEAGFFRAPVKGIYQFNANACVHYLQSEDNRNQVLGMLWLQKANQSGNMGTPSTASALGTVLMRRATEQGSAFDDHDIVEMSGSWLVELEANERVGLCARAEWADNVNGNTLPTCRYISFSEVSFSGSYVGGVSVTPRDPVAVYATVGRSLLGTENPDDPVGSVNLLPKIYKFDGISTRVCNQIFLPASSPYNTFVESADKSNAFNPQTGVFVAPVKGVYSIGFDISLIDEDTNNAQWYAFWIQKTSASVSIPETASNFRGDPLNAYANDVRREQKVGNAIFSDQNYHWLVEMEAGEKITWHMLGTNTNNNVAAIRLSANLLTSTQTIDPPLETPVSVYAHSNVRDSVDGEGYSNHVLYGQGIFRIRNGISVASNRTFTLNELVDTSGSFDVNTGVFTAPLGGLYSITAYAEMQDGPLTYGGSGTPSSNLYATMWIRKTPVGQNALVTPTDFQDPQRYGQLVRVSPVNNSETHHMAGDWLVQMNEGDQITWYANPNQLDNTAFGNKIQSIAISANLITPTDRNIKMSRGSAPAMVANSPDCGQILLTTTPKRIKNSELATISANPQGMTPFPALNCTVGVFTEDIDTHASFDPVTGIYTAPMKGLYEIQMSFNHFESASGVLSRYWIQKTSFGANPTDPAAGNYSNAINHPIEVAQIDAGSLATSGFMPYSKKWLVELEAGDMITWYAARDSGTGTDIIARNITLSAHLLTSTETVFSDGNPDVLFSVYMKNAEESDSISTTTLFSGNGRRGIILNANTPFMFKTVPYINWVQGTGHGNATGALHVVVESVDTASAYDPATGIFTSPVSGWYEFDFSADHMTANGSDPGARNTLIVWMEKNNTTGSPQVSLGAASDAQAATNLVGNRAVNNISWDQPATISLKHSVYLQQGETLCLFGNTAPSKGHIMNWRFSGKRIPPVNSSSGIGAGTVYSDYSATMPGWTRIAPGVIMQWGIETINTADTATWGNDSNDPRKTITFPKPFTATPSLTVTYQQVSAFAGADQSFVAQSAGVGALTAQIGAQSVQTSPGSPNGAKLHWQAVGLG